MQISFPFLDKMFTGSFRMYLNRALPAAYFRKEISEMKIERLFVQRSRICPIINLVSPRGQWYVSSVEQDITSFSNQFFTRIADEEDASHKTYLVYNALKNSIIPAFKAVNEYMNTLKKHPSEAELQINHFDRERIKSEENQVLVYVKACLAALYLDVQEKADLHKTSLSILNEYDIYSYYFLEEPPPKSLIVEAATITAPLKKIETTSKFLPLKGDASQDSQQKVSYKMVLKTDELFELEHLLFEHGLIDAEGHFIPNKARSHHLLMAVVYKKMIDAGFFRKNLPGHKTKLPERDYRSYLDDRYKTSLSQQFRALDQAKIDKACLLLPFLEHNRMFR